jgi:hypothetical protein
MQKFSELLKCPSVMDAWHFQRLMICFDCISGSNAEAQKFLQRDGQVIIRMRGLPFDATAKDVVRTID